MSVETPVTTDGVVVGYLNTVNPAFKARTKVPGEGETVPAQFARVGLVGGAGRRDRVIHDATVVVEAWAATYAAASAFAANLDGHMLNAPAVSTVIKAVQSFAGPAELPVPNSPMFRFTATYQVTTKTTPQ
jgi:hypothetical protein